MKLKFFVIILISSIFFCTVSNILIDTSSAELDKYNISIEKMSYDVIRTEKIGLQNIIYYKLIITLHNSGSVTSEPMTVVIIDDDVTEDYPGTKTRAPNPNTDPEIRIPPDESRDFVFGEKTEWMILGAGKHVLTVNVHPNNNETMEPICTKKFTIDSNEGSDGLSATNTTPGFDILLVISSILMIAFISKKRKK